METKIKNWSEDYEIQLGSSINGYTTLYRRIFYENGSVKRIVVGLTPEERELASAVVQTAESSTSMKKKVIDLFLTKEYRTANNFGEQADLIIDLLKTNHAAAEQQQYGYLVSMGGERKFLIAENISQALDRMDELDVEKNGCSMESHSSIPIIK